MFFFKSKNLFSAVALAFGVSVLVTSCGNDTAGPVGVTEFKDIARKPVKVKLDDTTNRFAADVMQSINYIPLETTKESTFSQVTKLELLDKYFVISDKTTNAVYFFYKDGKFSHKISNKGQDPEKSYKNISDFFIDRENQRIVLRDNMRLKLVYYDYNGKKTHEKDWPFDLKDFNSSGKAQFFYMGYTDEIDSNSTVNKAYRYKNLLLADTAYNIKKSYFKYDAKLRPTDLLNVNSVLYTSGSNLLFCDPYQYEVIKFSGDRVDKIFSIDFDSDNKLPNDYLTSTSLDGKRRAFLKDNASKIWAITETYSPNKDLLIFNLMSSKNLHNIFVYSLKTDKFFRLQNLYSSDKFSYMLPVFGRGIDAADDNYVYSNITSEFMYKAINMVGKSKNINTNPALKKFFNESNNLSNPILAQIKFKPF